jgi:pimeloyl-ACP methyl ester carboxylesterase
MRRSSGAGQFARCEGEALAATVGAMKNPRQTLIAALPVKERRLELRGVSTAVLQGGDGAPVILLHGPSGYAAHWMGVLPGLLEHHRVIVPDLPGHGASRVVEGPLDAGQVLGWLDELISRTCAAPPLLVGQLLGGAIGLRFAIAHGARLRGLALVDTFGLAPFRPAPQFAQALSAFGAEPSEATHGSLWRYCAFDADALRARMGERWAPFEAYNIERASAPEVQAAVSALMAQFGVSPIEPSELHGIRVPTALIWGRHDLATPLAVAEAAAARYGWPLHVIENANDDPPVEQPEALLNVLRPLLAEWSSAELAQ